MRDARDGARAIIPSRKPDARAQDQREHQLLAGQNLATVIALDRRSISTISSRQIARHLVAEQHADFAQELAKRLGGQSFVADQRQFMLNQRMTDDGDALH